MQPLHLYGGMDGSWEVKPPEVELPAPEPEPATGINIVRDTMERHKWLQQVAMHSDAWFINISIFNTRRPLGPLGPGRGKPSRL